MRTTRKPITVADLAAITAPPTPPREYGGHDLSLIRVAVVALTHRDQDLISIHPNAFAAYDDVVARMDALYTSLCQEQDDDRARLDATVDALYAGTVDTGLALTLAEGLGRGRDGNGPGFNAIRRACDRLRDDAVKVGRLALTAVHQDIVAAVAKVLTASNGVDPFDPTAADLLRQYEALASLCSRSTYYAAGLRIPAMTPTLTHTRRDLDSEADAAKAAADAAEARREAAQMQVRTTDRWA